MTTKSELPEIDLRYEPNLTDKLLLAPILGNAVFAGFYRLVTRPFSKRPKASTVLKDVTFAGLRAFLRNLNVAQETMVSLHNTEEGYYHFAKKEKFAPQVETMASGMKCCWFGPKSADKVLLFYHGGGYAKAASPGHYRWAQDLLNDLSKDHTVSIFMPAYTLSVDRPFGKGQYPSQIQEAAEALAWLLNEGGKKPSDIIIMGDSAGGHMSVSIMSHLLHPHPKATKIDLAEPLAGVILISPWTNLFPIQTEESIFNETSDVITIDAGRRWSALFLGHGKEDEYNNPAMADPKWFEGLETKVKDVLIWGGGSEAIIKSIYRFNDKLKAVHPRTELVVQPGASHDDFILEAMFGYKHKHEGTKVVESWIHQRL